ncbi:MAG: heavy metal translocating P-type ATPase [Pseudomonadota bacterium]
MTLVEHPRLLACPGCAAAPVSPPTQTARGEETGQTIYLSLPDIHCAACISTVENGLLSRVDVQKARVNLNRKQVTITAAADTAPEQLIDHLADLGVAGRLLDPDVLGRHDDATGRALLLKLAVAGFAMMNVMLMSVAIWSGATEATRTLFHWLSAAISLPTVAYAGQPFFIHGWQALRVGRLNMDVPISLALLLACGMSLYETAASGHEAYFDAALSLTFFLLIGRYLDHHCRATAHSAAGELAALEVPRVIRNTTTGSETVNLADIMPGDEVVVLPGGHVPVDGIVLDGKSDIDRALLTGESLPVAVASGSMLSAGEINLTGRLTLRTTAVGENTSLRKLVTMIDEAESARNRYTALADRAASIYAPVVHLLALGAFIAWYSFSGDARLAINIAIATLIITCPCALGLAVPAVSTAAAGRLFRQGLLVKNGTALERIAETDVVVFDKTGTLTESQLDIATAETLCPADQAIALALAVNSTHPVARAVAIGLQARGVTPAKLQEVVETPGSGIEAMCKGQRVRLGSAPFTDAELTDAHGAWLRHGDKPAQFIALTASYREGAADMIAALTADGKTLHLMSGDTDAATRAVAQDLGIPNVYAEQTPEQKIHALQKMAAAGQKVLMVGDGLNDTGALAAAYASVAPACAADAARAASDVVILGGSLAALPDLLRTAHSAKRRILENFCIAAGYNATVIPFAVAGFVTPLWAAVAMSTSSITVLLNALRLSRKAR